jgi:hypothetical protein
MVLRGFLGRRNYSCETIMIGTYQYTFVKIHRPYNTKHELRALGDMMCPYKFISCNKNMYDSDERVDNGKVCACVGAENT